jgi:hypothetical protein
MAIRLEAGSASATPPLVPPRAIWPLPDGDASEAENAFARAHALEADVPIPFQHALVSLDDGCRLKQIEIGARVDEAHKEMTPSLGRFNRSAQKASASRAAG